MNYDKILTSIVMPFFEEVDFCYFKYEYGKEGVLKELLLKYSYDRNQLSEIVNNKLNKINLYSFIIKKQDINNISKEILVTELLIKRIIFEIDGKSLKEDTFEFFIKQLCARLYFYSVTLADQNENKIFLDSGKKLLHYISEEEDPANIIHINLINIFKRCYYSAFHKIKYKPGKKMYVKCINLVIGDINYSKKKSDVEYITALINFLNISMDHLRAFINTDCPYVDIKKVEYIKNELIKTASVYLTNNDLISRVLITILYYDLYKIEKDIINNNNPVNNKKNEIIAINIILLKLFYKEKFAIGNIFDSLVIQKFITDNDIMSLYSKSLIRLLNDNERNVFELVYTNIFSLSFFPEYYKLILNLYKHFCFLSQIFHNRLISVLGIVYHLKPIKNVDYAKKELVKSKSSIELRPLLSLINFYNKEIELVNYLPDNLKNFYKANLNLINIQEKKNYIEGLVYRYMKKFRLKELAGVDKIKLSYMENIQVEMKNIYNIATHPYLVSDLGHLYIFFIDSYIKNQNLGYRVDFISKAFTVKSQILDMNPIDFAIALLFSKIGKIKMIFEHNNPSVLGIRKKLLTNTEKNEIAGYINFSKTFIPEGDSSANWKVVERAIEKIREPAFTKNGITPIESRILKVISAVLNKIIRQDMPPAKVFNLLYEEAYIPTKKEWDLDPILIFYFNAFFNKKGKTVFYDENTGKKLEVNFKHVNNIHIYNIIYKYLKEFIDSAEISELHADSQMEEISNLYKEPLIENNVRRNISLHVVESFIKNKKTVFFENNHIEKDDLTYLIEIQNNYLTAIGKKSCSIYLKHILAQLILNANIINYKREYFQYRNMNMDLKYRVGIKRFFETYKHMLGDLRPISRTMNLLIKVVFQIFNDYLNISVINNFKLHPEEINLLDKNVLAAKTISDIKKLYNSHLSEQESESTRIILIVLLLKKLGVADQFSVNIKENESIIKLSIPFYLLKEEKHAVLSEEIVKSIDSIPLIPDSIRKLKNTIDNPESTIDQIEKLILKDSSLTADVLKSANSAYYIQSNPVSSVKDCIKLLGRNGLNSILLMTSSYRLLQGKISQERVNEIINHCERTAFYARKLMEYKEIKEKPDEIFLSSLLHDIGKIVVEELNPDIYKKIQVTIENNNIPVDVLEDLAGGIDHSLIGYNIAMKWKYPKIVCEVIKCHHNPRQAEYYADAVFIVYLANALTYYSKKTLSFENIDANALDYFEMNDKDKLNNVVYKLENEYIKATGRV